MFRERINYTKDGTLDCRGRPADRRKTGTWKACPFIIGHEFFERLAYYGMSTNLLVYFAHELNQHSANASTSMSNWSGTCFAMPLLGAFIADSFLGRYWTIAVFSIVYVIGMILLALSAIIPSMRPTCNEEDICYTTAFQSALCFFALYLIAIGSGAIKPCVSSYGADQFDDDNENERVHKSSFFIWFYFSINLGCLTASSVLVWIQVQYGWGWGFGVSAVAMVIASLLFFSGSCLYRYQKPEGSPLTRLCQVFIASLRKYNVVVPEDRFNLYETLSSVTGSRKLDHTNQFCFLDKAATRGQSDFKEGGAVDPWRLCTVTQVEELKMILRLLPVLATSIIFSTVYAQMGNLFLLQATYMETRIEIGNIEIKVPEASLSTFDTISVVLGVIIYDRLVIPVTRRFTGHPNGLTPLQRIGSGLFISTFAMVSAMLLEIVRLKTVRKHGMYDEDEKTISIFWQVPQYLIIGFSEVLANIGQLEFFYDQAPDSMRSLCTALLLTTVALGNYVSSLMVEAVVALTGRPGWIPDNINYGHLDYFFGLLGVLSVINFGAFVVVARRFTCKTVRNLD